MSGEGEILNLAGPVYLAGSPLDRAAAAMVMIHGRGATAHDILTLVPPLGDPDFAYLAPQAPGNAWYPLPFTAPLQDNEPYLSSSLARIADVMSYLAEARFSPERIVLLGFSQGACLTHEYAARNARRYGAVVGLSGGLIGPDDLQRDDRGSLAGSPVFLGCSDVDPHIQKRRVQHAAEVMSRLGGAVTARLYPNMGHTTNQDEIEAVRGLMASVTASSGAR
jgi:predicted esterase